MYANVIVGVDGEPGGRNAVALAISLAASDARMTLVHVTPSGNREPHADDLTDEQSLRALFARELAICGGEPEITRVMARSVGAGLKRVAFENDSELIVVGSSRRHGVSRVLGRGDVKSVMRQAPCAVAVAPSSCSHKPNIFARIGIAFDGSPESEIALAHGRVLADDRGAQLILHRVLEPQIYALAPLAMIAPVTRPATAVAAAREWVSDADEVSVEQVFGTPREELVAFSRTVQLLVCGSRHDGLIKRIGAGSASDHLARHSAAPLIIVPATDDASPARCHAERRTAVA